MPRFRLPSPGLLAAVLVTLPVVVGCDATNPADEAVVIVTEPAPEGAAPAEAPPAPATP
jgi:hypothetical protein